MDDARGSGLGDRTRLAAAREALLRVVDPVDRSERRPVSTAIGRVLAADVEGGSTTLERGRRLRPSDPGICKAIGVSRVEVRDRPTVGVLPVGSDLVEADPGPEETVESNGLTVSTFADRWGGEATYRNAVPTDRDALPPAVQRDLTKDLLVTIGGTSDGGSDFLPDVIDGLGDVLVHGLAIEPGGSAGVGVVRDTPVVMLPGAPVAGFVAADRLLRPAVKRAGGLPQSPHPDTEAELAAKLPSEPGVQTFAPVRFDIEPSDRSGADSEPTEQPETDDGLSEQSAGEAVRDGDRAPAVRPVRAGDSTAIDGIAAADGWVVVAEDREGIPDGERISVERWEYQP